MEGEDLDFKVSASMWMALVARVEALEPVHSRLGPRSLTDEEERERVRFIAEVVSSARQKFDVAKAQD